MIDTKNKIEILTEKERNLLTKVRELAFGKIEVSVENNQPVRILKIKENINL